jgi:hypothetical protein
MMTRVRKIFLSIGMAALLIGGAVTMVPPLLWGDHVDYSHVAPINGTREYRDPALLEKAWALPVAALYHANIDFQSNASLCGPASIVNVLRSLHRSGDQFAILEGTGISTVMGFLPGGVTLDQLAEIARQKVGGKVTVLRGLDLASFRDHLRHANDVSRRYVINFTRGPLFGAGGGHHSPIAGYLVDEDLVLVLDVNKEYGPWLVKSGRLYDAMDTLDTGAQKKRGLLSIE